MHIRDLQAWAGHAVRLRMADGSEHEGLLRTELLTDQSISVYLVHAGETGGTTLYIDDIASVAAAASR
jgi:hypothetical protein